VGGLGQRSRRRCRRQPTVCCFVVGTYCCIPKGIGGEVAGLDGEVRSGKTVGGRRVAVEEGRDLHLCEPSCSFPVGQAGKVYSVTSGRPMRSASRIRLVIPRVPSSILFAVIFSSFACECPCALRSKFILKARRPSGKIRCGELISTQPENGRKIQTIWSLRCVYLHKIQVK